MKGNYLITCDNWFVCPDGRQYKSVWGNVEIVQDTFLGIKTNAHSSNWFAKIGTDESHIIIAGCQIHYAVKCNKPNTKRVNDYMVNDQCVEFERPTQIFIFD